MSYSLQALLERHAQARALQASLALPEAAALEALLDDVVRPVQRLLAAVGAAEA